jgi:hypothetical protein
MQPKPWRAPMQERSTLNLVSAMIPRISLIATNLFPALRKCFWKREGSECSESLDGVAHGAGSMSIRLHRPAMSADDHEADVIPSRVLELKAAVSSSLRSHYTKAKASSPASQLLTSGHSLATLAPFQVLLFVHGVTACEFEPRI